jgi:hypothetical protein
MGMEAAVLNRLLRHRLAIAVRLQSFPACLWGRRNRQDAAGPRRGWGSGSPVFQHFRFGLRGNVCRRWRRGSMSYFARRRRHDLWRRLHRRPERSSEGDRDRAHNDHPVRNERAVGFSCVGRAPGRQCSCGTDGWTERLQRKNRAPGGRRDQKCSRKPTRKCEIASRPISKPWKNSRNCCWKRDCRAPLIAGYPKRRQWKLRGATGKF